MLNQLFCPLCRSGAFRSLARTSAFLALAVVSATACADGANQTAPNTTSGTDDTSTVDASAPTILADDANANSAATAAAQATTPATSIAPTTSVPDWAPQLVGDYDVGAATIVLDDPERPLTVEVWFPLAPGTDTATLTPQRYSLLPTAYLDSRSAYAADPTMLPVGARFPLVVFSHGSGGLRYINSRYTEALASHGYVVVSTDHTGNTAADTLAGTEPSPTRFSDRVDDVDRLIDAFAEPTAAKSAGIGNPAAPYAAAVDGDQVAVIGHSLGGWTALAVAVGSDDPPAAIEPDDRIDAIVPIAPAVTGLLSAERLSTLQQPMLIIVGADDVTTPPTPHVDDLWAETSDSPAYRVDLRHAEHQSFTDVCVYQDELPSLPDVPEVVVTAIDSYATEGCQPDDMPDERANEIAVTYTVEFLAQVFDGGPAIDDNGPDDVTVERR